MTKLELNNGEIVDLTMNMAALYKLRSVRPDAYKAYNRTMLSGKETDTLDTVLNNLYMGYLCGMVKKDQLNKSMSFIEFLELLPEDMKLVMNTGSELINPKKRGNSENHFEKAPESVSETE